MRAILLSPDELANVLVAHLSKHEEAGLLFYYIYKTDKFDVPHDNISMFCFVHDPIWYELLIDEEYRTEFTRHLHNKNLKVEIVIQDDNIMVGLYTRWTCCTIL